MIEEVIISKPIEKRGEVVMQISLERSTRGVHVTVKSAGPLEELMRVWGDGQTVAVSELGRDWQPKKGTEAPLRVYHLTQNPGILSAGDLRYRLDLPGRPLIGMDPNSGLEVVNLSFLRLVGISEPAGVTFELRGVHSIDFLRKLLAKLNTASKSFYTDYLLPVDLTLLMQTQELR